jgi:hypothetical protein
VIGPQTRHVRNTESTVLRKVPDSFCSRPTPIRAELAQLGPDVFN